MTYVLEYSLKHCLQWWKNWKQHKCPLKGERINQFYIHTTESFTVVKSNEVEINVSIWINHKNIKLSEESKLQKNAVSWGALKCRHQDKIRHANNLLGGTIREGEREGAGEGGEGFQTMVQVSVLWRSCTNLGNFLKLFVLFSKISILFNYEGSKLGNVKYLQQSLAHTKSYKAFFYFHHNT